MQTKLNDIGYLGETDESGLGLTCGRCYYWPTSKDDPYFDGIIDDEEFTTYLCDVRPELWEIVLDPTGMAEDVLSGVYDIWE